MDAGGGSGAAAGSVGAAAAFESPAGAASVSSPLDELAMTGNMAPHDLQKRRVASFASPQSGH